MKDTTHHQEFLGGGDEARISNNRLQDNTGNLTLVGSKELLDGVDVIVGGGQGGGGGALGDTCNCARILTP